MSGNPRWRNGSPWRDPDVLHVLVVGALATVLSAGLVYLWYLWRTWSVARRAPCEPADAASIVVFGKQLRNGRPDVEFRWRLRRALAVARKQPQLAVLLTGGHSAGAAHPSEAEVARQWLLTRLPEAASRLHVEHRSRDTVDNLREVRHLLPPGPVVLLSNRYHLARCQVLARSLGMTVQLCAAEPVLRMTPAMTGRLAREAGYHLLFVVGRRWAMLIGHRRMLSRVH